MPASQLKQLKASIRNRREANGKHGSKPQPKLQAHKDSQNRQQNKRPKSQGEQNRRDALLTELQRRNKVGGIVDRRIGENDPTMAPEERALRRYTRQRSKRDSMFNLEEDEGEVELTHLGRSLLSGVDNNVQDDFEDSDAGMDDEQGGELMTRATKRRRLSEEEEDNGGSESASETQPERKKSKQEVMKEVIAKSKLHKYERQQAKDEDEDTREALNKDLPDLLALLRGKRGQPMHQLEQNWTQNGAFVHADRAAQISEDLDAKKRATEKEYDLMLRQMAQDRRAQPTERTKTAEEKAEAEARRLRELEEKRMRRMRGDDTDSDGEKDADEDENEVNSEDYADLETLPVSKKPVLDVEDEDDFVIDEDLVASGSDIDTDASGEASSSDDNDDPDDDEDFLRDVLPSSKGNDKTQALSSAAAADLPYTYPCPQTQSELSSLVKDLPLSDLPTVIQRIRALYHPQLNSQNSERLSRFAAALVDHLPFLASQKAPLAVVETVMRHIHSLSRKYPDSTAKAFRLQLRQMQLREDVTTGDLLTLTAIGSIYPTSDHFHQVVTPAITIMARWLGLTSPQTEEELRIGVYLVALTMNYQVLSKRYVPEALRFTLAALKRNPKSSENKVHIKNLVRMMDLWGSQAAFIEIFSPLALEVLESTGDSQATQKLRIMLSQSQLRRRPLELHHHRPLPIRSAIPKFEEGFNPDKHYDPDRERAESNKLRKEYKREKKGALRELKKDASFIAREKLKAKKEADRAYEIKQRRLIAEIQGEEGKEKNIYEREKRKRKAQR